jgi:virginiamycin B lyase
VADVPSAGLEPAEQTLLVPVSPPASLAAPAKGARAGSCLSSASLILAGLSILGALFAALLVLGAMSSDYVSRSIYGSLAAFLLVLAGIPAVIALVCALVLKSRQTTPQKAEQAPLVTGGIAVGLVVVLLLADGYAFSHPGLLYHPAPFPPAPTPQIQIQVPADIQVDVRGIVAGPDGNVWFTVPEQNAVGRITPQEQMRLFTLPTTGSRPFGIASGPDGNLWVTEQASNKILRLTPAGTMTEFPLPANEQRPDLIISGPDGTLWFLEQGLNRIGRMTTAGTLAGVLVIADSSPMHDLTVGPDGNVWVTQQSDKIGQITPAGQVTEFPLPSGSEPFGITTGPDGNLWFTERGLGQIGLITPSGRLSAFPFYRFRGEAVPPQPLGITAGPSRQLWVTLTRPGVRRDEIRLLILTGDSINSLSLPKYESLPDGIVQGPDGTMWFTERGQSVIGHVTNLSTQSEIPIMPTP